MTPGLRSCGNNLTAETNCAPLMGVIASPVTKRSTGGDRPYPEGLAAIGGLPYLQSKIGKKASRQSPVLSR